MSWVTVIWSMVASACLTLAVIYLLVWWSNRAAWANLLFALTAAFTAAFTLCELRQMSVGTPEELLAAMRWTHVALLGLLVSTAWFVASYLNAGRRWLAWTFSGLRVFYLLAALLVWGNVNYLEITSLRQVPFLGDSVTVFEGIRNPLTKMLDENEFLGPHGIRSISKFHERHPYVFFVNGQQHRVDYLPAESDTGMFGGNSNWRGPVWMPVNALIIRALQNFYLYYGDTFKIECPTGSGRLMNLFEVSKEISDRLIATFTRDQQGRRPVYGGIEKFQTDPHWRDYILFHEYFHGDNGAGLGASHQTGWTGLVATLIELYGSLDSKQVLDTGKQAAFARGARNSARRRPVPDAVLETT